MNWIGRWWTNEQWIAQSGHFLFGMLCFFVPFHFGHVFYAVWASALYIIYSFAKEVVLDPLWEDEPFIWIRRQVNRGLGNE